MLIETMAARTRQARTEPRMKVLLSGMMESGRGTASCSVRDLSQGGACLESDAMMRSGEPITFIRHPLRVSGVVAWARGRRFGMRFDAPIRATELLVQMSDSRRQQAGPIPAANALFPSR